MERSWQFIAPVDGAEKYARIQRHAASQQGRGGGRKDSRKRQSEDGFEKNPAETGGDVSEFRSCLFFKFLMKAQAENLKMKETIEKVNAGVQADSSEKLPTLWLVGSGISIR